MSENQEPKPEQPSIDELKKLAAEPGQINIGEGLKLDVGRIKEMFFKNIYCQGAIQQFSAARQLLKHEFRPDNPAPVPGRFCCFEHAMDAQFSMMIEGFALAAAIIAAGGRLPDSERKTLMHGFTKLFEEAVAVAEEMKATGGPGAHMPKPQT